jgi:hypothetical protein
MTTFFLPLLLLPVDFEGDSCGSGPFAIHKRKWKISTFDLATLASKHKLHIQYQLMDVLLLASECELEVRASTLEEARELARLFKTMMYMHRTSQFLMPYIATHSINSYSGINSRDSEELRSKLPLELRDGLTSDKGCVEVWPNELFLYSITSSGPPVTSAAIDYAANYFSRWSALEETAGSLRAARMALIAAPTIQNTESSILHIWQGIESLFPDVQAELRFRLSLLIAQLTSRIDSPIEIYAAVKRSYDIRSKITHGSSKGASTKEWSEAWRILVTSLQAVLSRNELPSEASLMNELLNPLRLRLPSSR